MRPADPRRRRHCAQAAYRASGDATDRFRKLGRERAFAGSCDAGIERDSIAPRAAACGRSRAVARPAV